MSEELRESVEEAKAVAPEDRLSEAEGREVPGEVTASSKHEEQARSHGWVPLEEWEENGNDPDDWVDPKTFNMRGEFFDTIHKQKREINEMKRAMEELTRMNSKARELEREKVLRELKEQKKLAIEAGDGDAVIEVEEEMERVRNVKNPVDADVIARAEQQARELMNDWTRSNPWYNDDSEMREYADYLGTKLRNEGFSPQDIFDEVPKRVKKQFASKFQNPRREQASVAPSTNNKAGKSSKPSWNSLNEDQKKVGMTFVRRGVMSKEDYVKSLADIGEV